MKKLCVNNSKEKALRYNAEASFSLRPDIGYFGISVWKNEKVSMNPEEEFLPIDSCVRLIFLKRTLSRISAFQRPEPQRIRKH